MARALLPPASAGAGLEPQACEPDAEERAPPLVDEWSCSLGALLLGCLDDLTGRVARAREAAR